MVTVTVDRDLEDLIPGFLANRERDLKNIDAALRAADFEAIRIIGHSMKGTGGGYGFDFISEAGARLEQAASIKDATAIQTACVELQSYLKQVEITYR